MRRYVLLVFRIYIGAVFIYASMYKIIDPGAFAESIRNYMLLPPALTNLAALSLSWMEMVCGTLLVLGLFPRSSAAAVSALLVIFIAALIVSLARGLDIDCGCFNSGRGSEVITGFYVLRDLALLGISVSVMLYDTGFCCLAPE